MSEKFNAAAKALSDDPELRERVLAANTSQERSQIMRDAGIDVPTPEDVVSGHNNLANVTGGGKTTNIISAGAPAVAAACGV